MKAVLPALHINSYSLMYYLRVRGVDYLESGKYAVVHLQNINKSILDRGELDVLSRAS